jgi:hypothetical protein
MVTEELFLKFGKFVILRYDKISSQNMHRKRERIKQKSKVKSIRCKKSSKLLMLLRAAGGLCCISISG